MPYAYAGHCMHAAPEGKTNAASRACIRISLGGYLNLSRPRRATPKDKDDRVRIYRSRGNRNLVSLGEKELRVELRKFSAALRRVWIGSRKNNGYHHRLRRDASRSLRSFFQLKLPPASDSLGLNHCFWFRFRAGADFCSRLFSFSELWGWAHNTSPEKNITCSEIIFPAQAVLVRAFFHSLFRRRLLRG